MCALQRANSRTKATTKLKGEKFVKFPQPAKDVEPTPPGDEDEPMEPEEK